MFDLYILENCPFCRNVMNFLEENDIKFNKIDVADKNNAKKLIELGGKEQVPFLADGDKMMYESSDIIEYVKGRYVL